MMVMLMLTRREVLKSHSTWQLMLKHAMWMAFEHRRSLEGLHERTGEVTAPVTLLEARLRRDLAEIGPRSVRDWSRLGRSWP